ncbi:YybH family protein [Mucilaginibacter pedocola]|uniref:SnoaL-like domain-containing protein n=1 Tax=Mucilaginibacter pedocola TaxID=1792845 RepID=A0A1S9PKK8_9SPHI|nr:nuclear transport factor 2 family protein [Mucilaginibacter pedocola]OOQ61487.1 hypothetical protein BC343_20505 [Mucilaginibacter pedocola]
MLIATGSLTAEAEIRELIDDKIIAVYNRDEHALISKYAPDVTTFDLAGALQNNGGLAERLEKWFSGYVGHINQEVANVQVSASGAVAFSNFLMRTWGTGVNGEEHDMWYRVTSGYKNIGGQWLITHEHISEPVDLETGKAMFGLKPLN